MIAKIQAVYRGRLCRRRLRETRARAVANWGGLFHRLYHVAYKSKLATAVQRKFRAHIRSRVEARAAVHVQRVFRGHLARVECALMRYEIFERKATVVQGLWRQHRARQLRLALLALRHRAAHAVQRCWRAYSLRKHLRDSMNRARRKRLAEVNSRKEGEQGRDRRWNDATKRERNDSIDRANNFNRTSNF